MRLRQRLVGVCNILTHCRCDLAGGFPWQIPMSWQVSVACYYPGAEPRSKQQQQLAFRCSLTSLFMFAACLWAQVPHLQRTCLGKPTCTLSLTAIVAGSANQGIKLGSAVASYRGQMEAMSIGCYVSTKSASTLASHACTRATIPPSPSQHLIL